MCGGRGGENHSCQKFPAQMGWGFLAGAKIGHQRMQAKPLLPKIPSLKGLGFLAGVKIGNQGDCAFGWHTMAGEGAGCNSCSRNPPCLCRGMQLLSWDGTLVVECNPCSHGMLACHGKPWHLKHAMACHGLPWHSMACHGMSWHAMA